tara:strand:- start:116 stop:280 length:165 start_codon:yes stop_codon:yes gene_type:complete
MEPVGGKELITFELISTKPEIAAIDILHKLFEDLELTNGQIDRVLEFFINREKK